MTDINKISISEGMIYLIQYPLFLQIFDLVAFIEQQEHNNNHSLM